MNQQQQQKLNELRGKAIRNTIILLMIIAIPFYFAHRCDKKIQQDFENEFHESDIVDLATFSKFVTIQAKDYCKQMNEIRQIKNSDSKSLETGKLIGYVDYFQNSTIRSIGMRNDLSDDIVRKAQDIFISELRKCGYFEGDYSEEESTYTNDESDYSETYSNYDENEEYIQNEPMDDGYNESEINKDESSSNIEVFRDVEHPKDHANVFWKQKYTLFDFATDESIFPIQKDGKTIYQIYYSTNEQPIPNYGEFTPEQLERLMCYKFKNKANCMIFCNIKNRYR